MNTESPKSPKIFKRWLLGASFVALTGIVGVAAAVGTHGGMRWHHGEMALSSDPATRAEQVDRLLRHVYVELDVTEAQQASLEPILKQAFADLAPLRERMRDGRRQGLEILGQPTIDRAALETLRANQLDIAEDASRTIARLIGDVAEILTPEQRQQLLDRIEAHHRLAIG